MAGPEDAVPAEAPGGAPLAWLGEASASPLRTLAVIWATVDLERTLAGLGRGMGTIDGGGPAPIEDPLLGARVVVVPSGAGDVEVAVAEPSTEGRLAATLARLGEGPAGRYVLAPARLAAVRTMAAAAGVAITRPAVGPFGPSVLVLTGLVAGPHLILVEPGVVPAGPAAVPSPP